MRCLFAWRRPSSNPRSWASRSAPWTSCSIPKSAWSKAAAMYIDKLLQVSDKQALTVTPASTDVIDAGAVRKGPARDLGGGEQLYAVFVMDSDTDAAGAATVTFSVQDSADNVTFADVVASGAIGKAALKAGAHVVLPLPPGMRRYIRANYT